MFHTLINNNNITTPDGVTRGVDSEGRWQGEVTRGGEGPLIPILPAHSAIQFERQPLSPP